MKKDYLEKVKNFDIDSLPDLDEIVLGALQYFQDIELPKIDMETYKRPLVIGSVNAFRTGQVIFRNTDAVFADEGSYKNAMKRSEGIDSVFLISSSGGKHSTEIAKEIKESGMPLFFLTNNPNAQAAEYVSEDNVLLFPKIREPYTYNTSTYMGMMLSVEDSLSPSDVLEFIEEKVSTSDFGRMSNMEAFTLIVPPEFDIMRGFFYTKFDELFEPIVSGRSFTSEEIKHAKIVVHSDKEFFISFGVENNHYGEESNRLFVPIPENCTYPAFLAIGYYVIGQIQKQNPPLFKEWIVKYTEGASKVFGQKINPIVE